MRYILCLCTALSLAFGAEAAPTVVSLTTGPDYPPFCDQNAPQGGIAVRIVRAVFARLGEPTVLDWLPWKRGYTKTLDGDYRATFPYLRSSEREQDFLFSEPILTVHEFLYMRRGDTLDFNVPASFRGRVLCVPLGYYSPLEGLLHEMLARGQVRLEHPPDMASCMRMLVAGRVDVLNSGDLLAREIIHRTGVGSQIQQSTQSITSSQMMLIAPRKNPGSADLIRRFNAGLQQIKADGSYAKLLAE